MNRDRALDIISAIDDLGRDYDSYEYGLPMFDEEYMEKMVDAILSICGAKNTEQANQPDATKEAP